MTTQTSATFVLFFSDCLFFPHLIFHLRSEFNLGRAIDFGRTTVSTVHLYHRKGYNIAEVASFPGCPSFT